MAVTAEQRNRLLAISVKEHGHIVDSFAALGRDPITIAIRQGIDPENVIAILHAYNLKVGEEFGDDGNDKGGTRRVPEKVIKEFVAKYYPGILAGKDEGISLNQYVVEKAMEQHD